MKNKPLQSTLSSILVAFFLMATLFGNINTSHAQSAEDWVKPENLSKSGSVTNPLLVIDQRGVFHVIWLDRINSSYRYVQSNDGVNWTTPLSVNYPFFTDYAYPTFLIDSRGLVHIFWLNSQNSLNYVRTNPEFINSPSNWIGFSILATSVTDYHVAEDGQGMIHLGYVKNVSAEGFPPGVFHRRLPRGSATWSNTVLLYESTYLRSSTLGNSHVRVAASKDANDETVYVVWDDRLQKRIFMAKSTNGGFQWEPSKQLEGPEDSPGFDTPFNIEISTIGGKTLIVWQVGDPGSPRCSMFSKTSNDGGENWESKIEILGESTPCPDNSEFIIQDKDLTLTLLRGQGYPALIAWNGTEWSALQIQNGLSSFRNPVTYDSILLGCIQDFVYDNRIYIVGCEQDTDGDIWFTSRSLGTFENWFSPPAGWNLPTTIVSINQRISYLSAIVGDDGNLHALWVQSPLSEEDEAQTSIQHSQWDGNRWTNPEVVFSGLSGIPMQLSMTRDNNGRLLLTWIDRKSGDQYFSWANADRARISSEWTAPQRIPSNSKINSASDILVDASGKVVIAYAIPINENRGIYLQQTTDLGKNWSQPTLAFNAVAAEWDMVDQPKISLSSDGHLHLLFSRFTLRGDLEQSTGLYYSQSANGGQTWSEPELVSENSISWSEIVSYDQQTLHRVWQELGSSVVSNFGQVSVDGGKTWSRATDITGVSSKRTPVALLQANGDQLHFIQLVEEKPVTLQDWRWDGSLWIPKGTKELNILDEGLQFSIAGGILPSGHLNVTVAIENPDLAVGEKNEIISFSQFVEPSNSEVSLPLMATPDPVSIVTEIPATPTSVPTQPPLFIDFSDTGPLISKNAAGLLLVGGVMIVILAFFIRRRSNKQS